MRDLTVDALGEHALIGRLRARVGTPPPYVTVGIGDDAAVVEPERNASIVVTTDTLVDGVHFRRDWTSLASVGHKALAVSLSDLAAMGAVARASLLSLALPADLPVADFDALVDGFVSLAERTGAPLVGGNITRTTGPLVVDSTAFGSVRPRRVLLRTGARVGDELYVTGTVGAAATGLALLAASVDRASLSADEAECVRRYERPEARLTCGVRIARARASSVAMDLSDGLADAARQIATAANLGVVVVTNALPIHPGAISWAARRQVDPIGLALGGGEDYELLFAVRPKQRPAFLATSRQCSDLSVTKVGYLTAEPGAWLEHDGARHALPSGFDHFTSPE